MNRDENHGLGEDSLGSWDFGRHHSSMESIDEIQRPRARDVNNTLDIEQGHSSITSKDRAVMLMISEDEIEPIREIEEKAKDASIQANKAIPEQQKKIEPVVSKKSRRGGRKPIIDTNEDGDLEDQLAASYDKTEDKPKGHERKVSFDGERLDI